MLKRNRLIFLIILIAFVYRIYILLNSNISFYSDDAIYAQLAKFWYQGNTYQAFHPTWPPLFPAVGALFFVVLQRWEIALQMVSIISFLCLLFILYKFIEKILGINWALLFAVFFGFFSPILKLSIFPMSDMLATSLVVSSIICTYLAIKDSNTKYYLLSGILLGTTFLVRAEGTLFFSLTLTYLLVYFFLNLFLKVEKRLLLLRNIIFLIIAFFITASPYIVMTRMQLGRWTLSQKFSAQIKQDHAFRLRNGTTWSQEAVSIKYPNYSSSYFSGGISHLLEYSDQYWWWFGEKLLKWKFVFLNIYPIWSLIVILIGALPTLNKKSFFADSMIIFIVTAGIPITIFSTSIADIRYLLWTIPLALFCLLRGIKRIKFNKSYALLIAFFLLLCMPLLEIKNILYVNEYAKDFTRNYFRSEIVETSKWISKNSTLDEPRILMRHEGIEFYTEGMTIYFPQEKTYEEVLKYANENNVDYFAAWTEEVAQDKNLSFLLEPDALTLGMKKVFATNNLILYELED